MGNNSHRIRMIIKTLGFVAVFVFGVNWSTKNRNAVRFSTASFQNSIFLYTKKATFPQQVMVERDKICIVILYCTHNFVAGRTEEML